MIVTPTQRAQLVRLLAAALVADVRQHPVVGVSTDRPEAPTGVSSGGSARTIVGRLHFSPLTPASCATFERVTA
jgi:hypothetical protein